MILIINELLQLYDLFGTMYYAIGIMEMHQHNAPYSSHVCPFNYPKISFNPYLYTLKIFLSLSIMGYDKFYSHLLINFRHNII